MVFFAGLPAAGKSLLLQQQALLAVRSGRRVHFLRWDAALAAFQTKALLAKYPDTDGVTHPFIRRAAGVWSRQAVARWHAASPGSKELLIGELPISGNRVVELVQRKNDVAEPLLAGTSTTFFVPVPSNEVRHQLVAKRQASITNPQHSDEARDAPMHTLENVWRETRALAIELGLVGMTEAASATAYDSTIYRRFFRYLLQHRNCRILAIESLYPGVGSAHGLDVASQELMASVDEVADFVAALEDSSSADEISRSVESWHRL